MRRRTPGADHALWALSQAANRSLLWLGIAAPLAAFGGTRGVRAARRGVVAIALASIVVNGPLKLITRRRRPDISELLPRRGLGVAPRSSSFPSGHTASAFAFAASAGAEWHALAIPLGVLASGVAYSRVHTGVHYPADVVAGAAVGVAAAAAAGRLLPARAEPGAVAARAGDLPRRAVLLVSPRAGSAAKLDEARRVMVEEGIEIVDEIPIEHHRRLDEWVAGGEQRVLVVAAGRDGTVGTAADHVASSGAVLGVLPLGTSNDFARSIGVPVDAARAARLLASGRVTTIDAGRLVVPGAPPRHFVHAATAGLSVSFAKLATRASLRRRFGRLTYAVAAAAALRRHESFECELSYDGRVERLELVHLAAINAPIFGGFLGMRVSGASLDDQRLDVIAVERLPLRRLLAAALHPLLGVRRPIRGIRTLHVARLHAHSSRELEVALDGEILGRIPADFEVAEQALRVITPADFDHAEH